MPLAASTCLAIALSMRQRRAEHAGADVGDVGQLEQALDGAVLAHRAVQQRQHDGALAVGRVAEHVDGRDRVAGGSRWSGSASRPFGERPAASVGQRPRRRRGEMPIGVMPVATRVGGAQHVRGSRATDVVLRRLPAEQDDEVDPIAGHPCRATVPCPADAVPGNRGGRGHRRAPGRARRRASTGPRSTPARCGPGQLFVPLVAERDGHDFIADALAAGAGRVPHRRARPVAARRSRSATRCGADGPRPRGAARRFAGRRRHHRQRRQDEHQGPGGRRGRPASERSANERSFNNEQGLPTTILDTPDDTEVLVVEMGMRGSGEIAGLCRIAAPARRGRRPAWPRPTASWSAGSTASPGPRASWSGAARQRHGDPQRRRHRVAAMALAQRAAVLTFGEADEADVRIDATSPSTTSPGRRSPSHTPWGTVDVRLGVSGRHMASTPAAALAVAGAVGADMDAARRRWPPSA